MKDTIILGEIKNRILIKSHIKKFKYNEKDHKKMIEFSYKHDIWKKNGIHLQLNVNHKENISVNHVIFNG